MNQHQACEIEICDEFWPYTRSEATLKLADSRAYILRIRTLLAGRACIKCSFAAPDQKFSTALLARDVSLEQIEHAIAFGCSRKYVSCLNGADCGPIVSFTYFRDLIEEAADTETPVGYWEYVMPQLKRLEAQWIARKNAAGATMRRRSGKKQHRRNDVFKFLKQGQSQNVTLATVANMLKSLMQSQQHCSNTPNPSIRGVARRTQQNSER